MTAVARPMFQNTFDRSSRWVGRTIHRVFKAPTSTLKLGQELQVDLSQLPLATVAASALLYLHGQEVAQNGDRQRWAKILAESGLLYAVIAHTRGVLPLLGLGTIAYKTGSQPDALSKVQEAVNTTSMLGMGYLGTMAGLGYSMSATDSEVRELMEYLKDPQLRGQFRVAQQGGLSDGLAERFAQSTHASEQEMVKRLRPLGKAVNLAHLRIAKYLELLENNPDPDPKLMQLHREKIDRALHRANQPLSDPKVQARFVHELEHLSEAIRQPGRDRARQEALTGQQKMLEKILSFGDRLENTQKGYVKLLRSANPIFGAMIGVMLIGIPVAKAINALIAAAAPGLKELKPEIPSETVWLPETSYRRSGTDAYVGSYEAAVNPLMNPGAFEAFRAYQKNGHYTV